MDSMVAVIGLIITVAIVATLVSPHATTASVIQAGASGLANNIAVAQSPVTGNPVSINTGYPSSFALTGSYG